MGTADRMQRDRLAKRARILDAARELFVERGIEAVTLREIAQRIEYSTTAIYVQFKDKQDLVTQMVGEDFEKFTSALGAKARVVDPVERLVQLGEAYVEFALGMPQHYRLLFMTPAAKSAAPPKEPPGHDGFTLLLSTVEECIAAGRFRPGITDARGVAQGVWAGVHGLVSLLIVMSGDPHFEWRSPAALLEHVSGRMLDGLLRERRPVQAAAAPAKPAARPGAAKPRRGR
ncbi:MAG: TetR/AcrR family transcriptional regulator [Myxococcota bacterium]|nr:TetR/AcrR family transcriptional regulator [Myxococcota bacterium]